MKRTTVKIPLGIKIYYVRDSENHPVLTVAIRKHDDYMISRATAFCSPQDFPPMKSKGKHIAIGRLISYLKNSIEDKKRIPGKVKKTHPNTWDKIMERYGLLNEIDIMNLVVNNGINQFPTDLERNILRMNGGGMVNNKGGTGGTDG